jgi:signal transduction histidine kinase
MLDPEPGFLQYERLKDDTRRRGRLPLISERPSVVNCLTSGMKLSLRFRFAVMVLMIVTVGATILGAANVTSRQVTALRRRLSSSRIEGFHIAEHLQISVLVLNATLLRFVLGGNLHDWQSFAHDIDQLEGWLKLQHPSTVRERQEMARVSAKLEAYRTEANAIALSRDHDRSSVLNVLSKIESASQKLLSLGYDLASAHRAAAAQLVDAAQKSLTLLQEVIFGALVLLLILGAWAATLVYREMIAPLQLKLVENRATIERHEKLASLGVLAAGVAHEIRNPLTAIKARLFTLRKGVGQSCSAVEDANLIEREINRLERIVRDVLSFAKPAEPRLEAVSAMAILREVRDLMGAQLEQSSIELTIENSVDVIINGDANQLKQVLLNLVRNGTDSVGTEGKIALRVHTERVSLGGRYCHAAILEVEDNGKGISPEVQKRLFDPFYTTKPAGTGLGLSIAARIVEQHGGALRYKTEMGRGTTFGIIVPIMSSYEK